jgi:ABC-type glutathione transport system ATPase component
MSADVMVEAQGLVKSYGADRRVVDDVSFAIRRGETLGLVGESGSGKSTVARMLLRLIEPTAGYVRYGGRDLLAADATELRGLRRRMQIVFQDPYAALNPRMRVREILTESFSIHSERPAEGMAARLTEIEDQHCAGAGVETGVRGFRRTCKRARRLGRSAGSEPAEGAAAGVWINVSVYLALDAACAIPV